jgi:flavin-dependent dehydrogenase
VVRSPGGREVVFPLPPGPGSHAAVARRSELDAALVRLARDAGAEVHEGCALLGATESDDGIRLTVEGVGELSAAWAVGADGMWSPLRKALGAAEAGYLGEWHAFRQYARGVTGTAASRLYVWFEPDLLPGYAWSFPLPGGRANIGFGVLRDGTRRIQDMKDLWTDLLRRGHVREALGPDAELEGRHTAWPIPARVDRVELANGRTLFVGDAAAATDVMTGEGIGQALLTGRLAAEAILAGGSPDDVTRRYTRSVRRELVADHRMSLVLSRILASPIGARGAIRVIDGSGTWGKERFARWMFEDEPRAVVLTPHRWHRRFLARPGAYQS